MAEANSLFEEDNKSFGSVLNGARTSIVALARVINPDAVRDMHDEGNLVCRAESLVQSSVP